MLSNAIGTGCYDTGALYMIILGLAVTATVVVFSAFGGGLRGAYARPGRQPTPLDLPDEMQ
jgi:hypothetical protein